MKKLYVMVLALLLCCVPAAAGEAVPTLISADLTEVILVADNQADCAVAEALSDESGATIVKTAWGEFEQSVLDTIVEAAPDSVTIIGGPMAVVEDYETGLEEAGITFERVWGQTRQQTSLQVFEKFRARYNWSAEVGDGAQPYRNTGCPVWFYDNETEIDDFIQQRRATVMNYGQTQRFAGRHGAPTVEVTAAQVQNFGQEIRSRIQSRYGNNTWVRSRFGMMGSAGRGGMMGGS